MPRLKDFPIARERLERLRTHRSEWFRIIVQKWGVQEQNAEEVIQKKYISALSQKPHPELRELLDSWKNTPENIDALDRALITIVESPKLEDYKVVCDALETICTTKLKLFKALAQRWHVQAVDADAVINEAYLAIRNLEARGDIQALLQSWSPTRGNVFLLEDALSALFVTYLHFKCKDYVRKHKEIISTPPEDDCLAAPNQYSQIEAKVSLDQLEAIVDQMYSKEKINAEQMRFWRWRRANPDANQQEFDPSLSPPRIAKLRKSLYRKIVEYLLKNRGEGREGKNSSGQTL